MSVKHKITLALGAASVMVSVPVAAQEAGDTYVRVGAARTKLVDKGDIFVNGVQDPEAGYATRETYHGVVTIGAYVVDHVALEGSLSTPATTNNVPAGSLAGTPNLGDDEFVVATVGATLHPLKSKFSPYFGGGLQMQFTTQERDGLGVGLNIPHSYGPYLNAGFDYKINNKWGFFVDARKAWYHTSATGLLPTDATLTNFAAVRAKAELDPLTIQAGITAHFGKADEQESLEELLSPGKKWTFRAGISNLELRDRAEMLVGGIPLEGEGISTHEHHTPSLQIGYALTENFAINATVGLPPKIDIFAAGTIGGLPKLGEATYGPTALTVQYHPTTEGRFKPYVGVGMSYMIVFGTNDGAFGDLRVDNDLALAFEAGTDIMLGKNWGLFMDVKKAFLRPNVTGTFELSPGVIAPVETTTKLDPWVFSGGITFKL